MSSGRQGYVAVRAVVVRQELSGGRYVFGEVIDDFLRQFLVTGIEGESYDLAS